MSSEISFGVPEEAESRFDRFFKEFDFDMQSLGVVSYGISITTLEEVFLHINAEFGLDLEMVNSEKNSVAHGEDDYKKEPEKKEELVEV